ncbi:MAG: 50S ribosomal protein L15 [bacterium ADurb.Bin400]|nr:MAG: 50S ribosomal protein L15 [bacterium ADurb.Bin400]
MTNLLSVKSRSKKRVGRGLSAGQGKTAGRGTKGQKSRAGYNIPTRFEGGQTPLSMRLPKLPGFTSHNTKPRTITTATLSIHFTDGETVTLSSLKEKKLIKNGDRAKVVLSGELKTKITLGNDVSASKAVQELISK